MDIDIDINKGIKKENAVVYNHPEAQSSTTQLIDPPLYSIYGGRNIIDSENQDIGTSMYNQLSKNGLQNDNNNNNNKKFKGNEIFVANTGETNNLLFQLLINSLKTLIFGYTLFFLFNGLHINNSNIIPFLKPFINFYKYPILNDDYNIQSLIPISINIIVLDIVLSIVQFILNFAFIKNTDKFKIKRKRRRNTSILQLFVALIGIIYFFKKITWKSTIQADLLFLIINLFFSKYIGCSFKETFSSFIVSLITYFYDNIVLGQSNEFALWKSCFIFFTCVSFIKIKKSDSLF